MWRHGFTFMRSSLGHASLVAVWWYCHLPDRCYVFHFMGYIRGSNMWPAGHMGLADILKAAHDFTRNKMSVSLLNGTRIIYLLIAINSAPLSWGKKTKLVSSAFFDGALHMVSLRWNLTLGQNLYFTISVQIWVPLEISIDTFPGYWCQIHFRNDLCIWGMGNAFF